MPPKKKSGKKKKGKKSGKKSAGPMTQKEQVNELTREFYAVQIKDLENRLTRYVICVSSVTLIVNVYINLFPSY